MPVIVLSMVSMGVSITTQTWIPQDDRGKTHTHTQRERERERERLGFFFIFIDILFVNAMCMCVYLISLYFIYFWACFLLEPFTDIVTSPTPVNGCMFIACRYRAEPEHFFSYAAAVTITSDGASNLDLYRCLALMADTSEGSSTATRVLGLCGLVRRTGPTSHSRNYFDR